MKKKLLVLLFIFIYGAASAQFTIWEDDFDDSDVSDWTFIDEDGDGSGWRTRNNIQIDENGAIVGGTYKILGDYSIELEYGQNLPGPQKNWAVAPAIDLSYYAGSMELNLTVQKAIYGAQTEDLYVYVSTTDTAPGSFTLVKNVNVTRGTMLDVEFNDYVVDISPYVGLSQVYIALLTPPSFSIGYEIDKMWITAQKLGLDDVEANGGSLLKQNPVKDYLQLYLSDSFNKEETKLKIYNTTGSFVQESKYNEAGVQVGNLSKGIYFLVIEEGTKVRKLKFIKE